MKANVVDFQSYKNVVEASGKPSRWAYECSLYELIQEFVTTFESMKRNPFDGKVALWLDTLSEAVAQRCQNEDLLAIADKFLEFGVSKIYSI